MLSLKPYWDRKILRGEKTADIRKSMPRRGCPFRTFLYETKSEGGCGAVTGECVCYCADHLRDLSAVTGFSLLSVQEITDYARGRKVYAWFLAQVVRYNVPKPISEFGLTRAPQSWRYVSKPKFL